MQRRRNTKYIRTKFNLHSIPILFMLKKVRSNVLYSIPSVVVLVFLFGLLSLLQNILYSNSCYAATSASLSLSNPNMTSNAVVPGSIATTSTNVTVSVSDAESYSLTLKVDSTTITNGSTGTNNTLTAGNPNDSSKSNVWGYKWDNASTYTAPTTTGTILTSSTNPTTGTALSNGSTSFTKTLTFGAKFSSSANAGTYHGSGTISLVATPRATVYTLTLDNNNGTGGTPSKTCSTYTDSCTISLSDVTAPTRAGYAFLGWADDTNWINIHNAIVTPYNTLSAFTMTKDRVLYAVYRWGKPGFNSITNMQQMTSSICSSAAIGDYKELIDTRESDATKNRYIIQKFNDGKCWMTQNLRLTNKTISSSDSNVSSTYTIPNTDPGSDRPTSWTTSGTANYAWYSSAMDTAYYSWYTAAAGTSTSVTANDANVSASICPKGWRLPTGGTSGNTEFYKLFDSMDKTIFMNNTLDTSGPTYWAEPKTASLAKVQGSPYYFNYTGRVHAGGFSGNFEEASSNGYWLSSTLNANSVTGDAYVLRVYYSVVHPGTTTDVSKNGYAVRCVAS